MPCSTTQRTYSAGCGPQKHGPACRKIHQLAGSASVMLQIAQFQQLPSSTKRFAAPTATAIGMKATRVPWVSKTESQLSIGPRRRSWASTSRSTTSAEGQTKIMPLHASATTTTFSPCTVIGFPTTFAAILNGKSARSLGPSRVNVAPRSSLPRRRKRSGRKGWDNAAVGCRMTGRKTLSTVTPLTTSSTWRCACSLLSVGTETSSSLYFRSNLFIATSTKRALPGCKRRSPPHGSSHRMQCAARETGSMLGVTGSRAGMMGALIRYIASVGASVS
mmetsp:Transcript_65131/g.128816  ORF Transcript_65131/g.128816 Transcript_65131/m.128816 type:complete len:276 (+) Transcript_65131:198-1025(+)